MSNRAFGLGELLGREIDGVDDEDQLGRRSGRRQRVVPGANLCRMAIVEKSEIRGREVRHWVPCRIRYNQIDGEEAIPNDGITGAQVRQWLLRNRRILQRRGLPARSAGAKNKEAREKGRARQDGSIHHDSVRHEDSR